MERTKRLTGAFFEGDKPVVCSKHVKCAKEMGKISCDLETKGCDELK